MTKDDVKRIFGVTHEFTVGLAVVSVDDFLDIAGFRDCEPTKDAMLEHDGGTKGYREFIESGNWETPQ